MGRVWHGTLDRGCSCKPLAMPAVKIEAHDAEYMVRVLRKVRHPDQMTLHWRAEVDLAAGFIERLLIGAPQAEMDSAETRHAAATELEDWAGRDGDRIAGPEGLQHAVGSGGGTRCGIPAVGIVVYRHLFDPGRLDACDVCRAAVHRP